MADATPPPFSDLEIKPDPPPEISDPPTLPPTVHPVIVPPADPAQPQSLAELLEQHRRSIEGLGQRKPKDAWDKLAVLGTLVSTVLIGAVGTIFTITYQRNETANRKLALDQEKTRQKHNARIQDLDLVVKLLPALSSNDPRQQKQAYLTVKALGNVELLTTLALNDPTAGAQAALQTVASSPRIPIVERERAKLVLDQIQQDEHAELTRVAKSVVYISAKGKDNNETASSGFVWNTPKLIVTTSAAVENATHISIVLSFSASPIPARVNQLFPHAGLALLEVDAPLPCDPLKIANAIPERGERATIVGYIEQRHSLTFLFTSLIGLHTAPLGFGLLNAPLMTVLYFDGLTAPGVAGAPLVTSHGDVVGIVLGRTGDESRLGVAVPATYLATLLPSDKANL